MKRLIESGVCVNSQDGVSRLSDCTCTCIAYYPHCHEISKIFALCIFMKDVTRFDSPQIWRDNKYLYTTSD